MTLDSKSIYGGLGCDIYRLYVDEEPVLVLRLLRLAPGTIEVVMIPERGFKSRVKEVIKEIPQVMEDYFVSKRLNRIQANTPDEPRYHRFMQVFGFKSFAVLKKFNDGADYILWEYMGGE